MNSKKAERYVFLTSDLMDRADFYHKNRFKYYSECDLDECDDLNDECGKDDIAITLIEKKPQSGIHKIWSFQKAELKPTFAHPNGQADSHISDDKIEFAILNITEDTNLFREVVEKRIPFTFISPNGPKCEWLDLNGAKAPHECINCEEKKKACKNSKCKYHIEIYENKEIGKSVTNYKIGFSSQIQNEFVDKVPIFELSTAIDILRWWNFYTAYLSTQKTDERKDLRNREHLKNVLLGLFDPSQDGKNVGS